MKNRHAFVSALFVTLSAITALGCNEKHRKAPPSNPAPIGTTLQTQAEEIGLFVEGRIIDHHYKSHPEWDFSIRTAEPLVNRGRWVNTPKGIPVWIPFWVENAGLVNPVLLEVDQTEPEGYHSIPTGSRGPNPIYPCRIVICEPGAFCYDVDGLLSGTNIARGLINFAVWWNPQTQKFEDVIFVGWRVTPYENGPYLTALDHEYAHNWSRDPLANHGSPTGESSGWASDCRASY